MTSPSMSTTVGDSRDERQLDLAPIKARTEAATDAPWHPVDLRHQRGGQIRIFPKRGGWIIANVLAKGDNPDADAEFVAHAREDIPALIAEVERLRALVDTAPDPDRALRFDQCPSYLDLEDDVTRLLCVRDIRHPGAHWSRGRVREWDEPKPERCPAWNHGTLGGQCAHPVGHADSHQIHLGAGLAISWWGDSQPEDGAA